MRGGGWRWRGRSRCGGGKSGVVWSGMGLWWWKNLTVGVEERSCMIVEVVSSVCSLECPRDAGRFSFYENE